VSRYICVHGHFYQPPRENPWLEEIEVQDSAYPYHDWNERITAECYAPNTASRVLNEKRRITAITDNYRYMSFNFGPTLLAWMARRSPETHRKIVASDRDSRAAHGGHGAAMAQVYNHVIMPLASRRDKITQIRWGIKDFESRFGRRPEGMWLAETAVDTETLELLAREGILFTVLSPHQARRIRPLVSAGETRIPPPGERRGEERPTADRPAATHDPAGVDVTGGAIDPSRAYRWVAPSGVSLAVFFYDAPISRAVAFEGLLGDGNRFAARLMSGFSDQREHPQLVHIATDGESYGHHHRYGDMALAYAFKKIGADPSVRVTNYGEFLSLHPPSWDVEIIENSSWSCAHGVERWRSDCGCRMGYQPAWNQKWRTPLRDGLNHLKEGLDRLFETFRGTLFKEPWEARDAYIELLLDRRPEKTESFLGALAPRPLTAEERSAALRALEMQRHGLLMFTSCAWFFDEISGLESTAVLASAARAMQLARHLGGGETLEREFLAALAGAHSNLPDLGTGADVYARLVKPQIADMPRLAAHQALRQVFQEDAAAGEFYQYDYRFLDRRTEYAGGGTFSIGRVKVDSRLTGESLETAYALLHAAEYEFHCLLKPALASEPFAAARDSLLGAFRKGDFAGLLALLSRDFDPRVYTLHSLFLEERRRILNLVIADVVERFDRASRHLIEENRRLMDHLKSVEIPVPAGFRLVLQAVLQRDVKDADALLRRDETRLDPCVNVRREADRFGILLDWTSVARTLGEALERRMKNLVATHDPSEGRAFLGLVGAARRLSLSPSLWHCENMLYDYLKADPRVADRELLGALAEALNFDPDATVPRAEAAA
jgi:alpha-amylase/alpha-mannosidase (GH57 family)